MRALLAAFFNSKDCKFEPLDSCLLLAVAANIF